MKNRLKITSLAFILNLIFVVSVFAMSSENYQISQDSINFSGSDDGRSANYELQDTAGEVVVGESDSANYTLNSGYRQNDDETPYMSFDVAAADPTTKIDYTALGTNVATLSTTSGFAIGDYVVISENEGYSQKAAVGKILQINGNDIMVDFWSGDFSVMSPVPAGVDDFAYKLTGNTVDLGKLSLFQVSTGLSFYNITTSARNGYTVSVSSDHAMRAETMEELISVSDNEVSAGDGEYGIKVTGDDVSVAAIDFTVPTSPFVIASSSDRSDLRRAATIYKASGNNLLMVGHYQQSISYIATLNF